MKFISPIRHFEENWLYMHVKLSLKQGSQASNFFFPKVYFFRFRLKCFCDQKLTSFFFLFSNISKVLILNTYHARFQVFNVYGKCDSLSHNFWLRPAAITQIWPATAEKVGTGRNVTSSKQRSTLVAKSLKLKLKLFLRTQFMVIPLSLDLYLLGKRLEKNWKFRLEAP